MSFTLGRHLAGKIRLHVPLYGVSTAEIELLDGVDVTGEQILMVGDLRLVGTVTPGYGGIVAGRGHYQWRSGAGRWGAELRPKAYGNSLGVLRSTVIREAAEEAGERVTLAVPELRLGLAPAASYARLGGPAWSLLRRLRVPWYVDAEGVTQIAERPAAEVPDDTATLVEWDRTDGRRVLNPAGEAIAGWVPGRTFGPEQIVSLDVVAETDRPIALTIYTRLAGQRSHDWRTQQEELIVQQTEEHRFFGCYRYAVVSRSTNGKLYGLAPVRTDLGLPIIGGATPSNAVGVALFPGAAGHAAELPVGYRVALAFLDGDPGTPFIVGFEPPTAPPELGPYPSTVPITSELRVKERLNLGDAAEFVARKDDPVNALTLTISWDQSTLTGSFVFNDAAGIDTTISVTGGVITSIFPAISALVTAKIGTPLQTKVRA